MIAPEFPPHLKWLNATKAYSIKDFKGKFILLDFWTYCCINCMHVLPELKLLENKFPELVVIGVHSAKFHNERILDGIKQAILRYDIERPVIVDNDFEIWKTYGIDSWPSFILIGPDRQIIGRASGEGIFERLNAVMNTLIDTYQKAGRLDRNRISFPLLKASVPETVLRFPGKIEVDPLTPRLFISDSNHNRILVASPEGEVKDVIGSGREGSDDGTFEDCSFFRPQGTAFDGERNCLYIADTENHLLRKADLAKRNVSTLAGSKRTGLPQKGRSIRQSGLNSPWDLIILEDQLYVAMAGSHQIWRMDLNSNQIEIFAGTGEEGITDGPRTKATLAQPSGITTDGHSIYFLDSEASALRMIEDGVVTTLIGKGLFVFGDTDGLFPEARLQHPIGIYYHSHALYIADSYNHKLKKADLRTREVSTLVGDGQAGRNDGRASEAGLYEPNDVVFLDGRFYIADTNNHQIRIYDPVSWEVSTLQLKLKTTPVESKPMVLTERAIAPETEGVEFELMLPAGFSWNPAAEQQVDVSSEDPDLAELSAAKSQGSGFSYLIPLQLKGEGCTNLRIHTVGYFCDKESLCCFKPAEFVLPIRIERGLPHKDVTVTYLLQP
jgi:thiol-disulfide isomerase/thioredoxin